jgi:hypothetical protein
VDNSNRYNNFPEIICTAFATIVYNGDTAIETKNKRLNIRWYGKLVSLLYERMAVMAAIKLY